MDRSAALSVLLACGLLALVPPALAGPGTQFCPASCSCDCPPPPPPAAPSTCRYDKPMVLSGCSQKNNLPYKLDDSTWCELISEAGKNYTACYFTIKSKACNPGSCISDAKPRSLYLLLDRSKCFRKAEVARVKVPGGTWRQVFGHWDQGDSCLFKYTLTTDPAGVPMGTQIKVILPATGDCSDLLTSCRPGTWDGSNVCHAAVADFTYKRCPFSPITVSKP